MGASFNGENKNYSTRALHNGASPKRFPDSTLLAPDNVESAYQIQLALR